MLTFKQYIHSLKSIYGLVGSVAVIVPAFAYFSELAPPLMPASVTLVSALAAAALVAVYQYKPGPQARRSRMSRGTIQGLQALGIATVLLVVYVGFLSFFTVSEGGERFQIGFYRATWSLTQEGVRVKTLHAHDTPWQWMMNDGLFTEDGPEKLWEQWTRYLTFLLMFIDFAGILFFWSAGWGLLARENARRQRYTRKRRPKAEDVKKPSR